MSTFLVDTDVKVKIRKVREFAERHYFTRKMMKDIKRGKRKVPSDVNEHSVRIPYGYRAVFTIESDVDETCYLRHLSVSCPTSEAFPTPEQIKRLLPLFGYTSTLPDTGENLMVRTEKMHTMAFVHIWEQVSETEAI